jgi:hypothetical protein
MLKQTKRLTLIQICNSSPLSSAHQGLYRDCSKRHVFEGPQLLLVSITKLFLKISFVILFRVPKSWILKMNHLRKASFDPENIFHKIANIIYILQIIFGHCFLI